MEYAITTAVNTMAFKEKINNLNMVSDLKGGEGNLAACIYTLANIRKHH